MPNATTSNNQAPSAPAAPTGPAAQLASALGLPHLLAQAPTVAANLAAWVAGQATGRRGITVQGTYLAATALAQAVNGGNPVTPAQVAATYLAAGAVAPGRGNATGYGASNGLTNMHSAYYGANKHLTGTAVKAGPGTAAGAPTYSVPAQVVQLAQQAPTAYLRTLAQQANANLAAYVQQPCGCNAKGKAALAAIAAGNKPQAGQGACGTGRKGATVQLTGPVAPTAQASKPTAK